MQPIDINKELPLFPQELVSEEEIKEKEKDGLVLIRNSEKGCIWYKLPEYKFDEEEEEEEE